MKTAVLFLIFNRPDTTKKVFEAIRQARPNFLYINADGPRKDKEGEVERVESARRIATAVDWPCVVKTRFQQENLGCKRAISEGITWFFEHVDRGIILEDDCLPSKSFFPYCEKMLELYRDQQTVMHIGGFKPHYIPNTRYSISFTRATHVWGWATWADRWAKYSVDVPFNDEELKTLGDFEYFISKNSTFERMSLLQRLREGAIDTWDYQWNLAVRINSGLAIRPDTNLVENIGHGHQFATHTNVKKRGEQRLEMDIENMSIPKWILPERNLEAGFEKNISVSMLKRVLKNVLLK